LSDAALAMSRFVVTVLHTVCRHGSTI